MGRFNFISGKALTLILLAAVLVCGLSNWSKADDIRSQLKSPDAGKIQVIELMDGSKLVGRITEVSEYSIKFKTESLETTIEIAQIKSIEEQSSSRIKGGKYWFKNPNMTRLYLSPTGRMLEAGEGYFSDILIFFPSVAYGITDFISLGAGMSIFPGVDFGEQLIYVMPRLGSKVNDRFSIAASAMIMQIPIESSGLDENEGITLGVFYGNATYGTEDLSVTFGAGFGYAEGNFSDNPAIIAGGEYRFARRVSFVTENWIFPEVDDPLISYGVRFFGENIAVDLALFNILDEDAIFPGIPFVSFIYNF